MTTKSKGTPPPAADDMAGPLGSLQYRDSAGRYVTVWPRAPHDHRRYQVIPVMHDAEQDALAVVDDFGALVVTHRRDPATPHGMGFRRVQPMPMPMAGVTA